MANTGRFKVSTIPYMQRVLNDDYKKSKREMSDLNNDKKRVEEVSSTLRRRT